MVPYLVCGTTNVPVKSALHPSQIGMLKTLMPSSFAGSEQDIALLSKLQRAFRFSQTRFCIVRRDLQSESQDWIGHHAKNAYIDR
jgi:hypothetical protein